MPNIKVKVYDRYRVFQGEESLFSKLDVIRRHRDVGSWSVTMPNTEMAAVLKEPGSGIQVKRDGKTLIEGPMLSVKRTENETTDNFVISGLSQETMLWEYLSQPSLPSSVADGLSQFDEYDSFNGAAESLIKHYVTANLLDPDRQVSGVPTLTVSPDLERGPITSTNARFDLVGDLVNGVVSDNMGYSILDNVFDIYEPQDRTRELVFSFASGNLLEYSYTNSAPKVTHPVVAGGGQGADRLFYLADGDAVADKWGRRIESFIDARDTTDPFVLQQRALKAQTDGGEQTAVTLKPIDVPNRTFGVDYNVGDIGLIQGIPATIAQVEISIDEKGETITPTGSVSNPSAAQSVLSFYDDLRRFRRQLLELQAKF